jgi:hypothetical protein
MLLRSFPWARHRFAQGLWHLGEVHRVELARFPNPGAYLTAEVTLVVHARREDGAWRPAAGECVAEADFDAGLAPLSGLARALAEAAAAPLVTPADLVSLVGTWGELQFGPPDPVTGFQLVSNWKPADDAAGTVATLPSPVGGLPPYLFRAFGRNFEIHFSPPGRQPEAAAPPGSKGLAYYGRLLRTPGRAAAALDLAGGGRPARPELAVSGQEVADREALRAAYNALQETRAELEEARRDGDLAAAERLAETLHRLQSGLAADRGLGKKARKFREGDPATRAANAVNEALARARETLRVNGMPGLADHLKAHVCQFCGHFVYLPPADFPGWSF